MKEKYSIKNLCGNNAKEIYFIYKDVDSLKFNEVPNYDNYIYLLENYVKLNTGKSVNDILFDWEKRIKEQIKYYNGIKNYLKSDNKILALFEGYPVFYIEKILEKYN